MIKTIDRLSKNNIISEKQDHLNATFAPKIIVKRDCKIDWNLTVKQLHNQIRAFSPQPGAFTYYKNKRVKLFGSKIDSIISVFQLKPGQINYQKPYLHIGTGSASLLISEIQFEGKKKISIDEFILGNYEIIGEYFE